MLSTDQKGALAEATITAAAIELGVDVFRPLSDGARYDLIFDLGHRLMLVGIERLSLRHQPFDPVAL